MEKEITQAVAFFKSEKAYRILFKEMRKKYESLGRIGGTISIRPFSEEELEVIATYFGMTISQLKMKKTISILAFEKQLQATRFSGIGLKELLDAYFGETIQSKKQFKLHQEYALQQELNNLKRIYPKLSFWFDYIKLNQIDTRWVKRLAQDKPKSFQSDIKQLNNAFVALPVQPERLPMFSQRITGNPHAFDLDRDLGKMLLHVLSVHSSQGLEHREVVTPNNTESINELLQRYHIYRDDLLNFVTCANLLVETDDGKVHPVWKTAAENHFVQNVPLRELVSSHIAYPVYGKDIWLVENSGVCSALLDTLKDIPIICTNGQFKLATFMLMDLLVKADCILHYAGDFDPEGLQMAERLLNRYPQNVQLWRMNLTDYQKSNPVKRLTEERLEKLNSITHKKLLPVVEEMQYVKRAGYQEALVSIMLKDVQK